MNYKKRAKFTLERDMFGDVVAFTFEGGNAQQIVGAIEWRPMGNKTKGIVPAARLFGFVWTARDLRDLAQALNELADAMDGDWTGVCGSSQMAGGGGDPVVVEAV